MIQLKLIKYTTISLLMSDEASYDAFYYCIKNRKVLKELDAFRNYSVNLLNIK